MGDADLQRRQFHPTLAVITLAMTFLGIGFAPAFFGLFVASLLPIVRNTYAGLLAVPSHLKEAATGMGMTPLQISGGSSCRTRSTSSSPATGAPQRDQRRHVRGATRRPRPPGHRPGRAGRHPDWCGKRLLRRHGPAGVPHGDGDAILFWPGHFAGLASAPPAKPLIAAVEGPALARGCELALACDMIIASRTAAFGLPKVTVSTFAVGGGAFRPSRRIPHAKALELCLTGDRLSADEAGRLGLLNAVTEPGEALADPVDLAERIARNAPLAVADSLELARASRSMDEGALWVLSDRLWPSVASSPDAREGPRVFREKRRPARQGPSLPG